MGKVFSLDYSQYTESFMAWADLQTIDLQPGFISTEY